MTIQKVAVIGSGVMGSGIAAQLANAGIEVELLDIVPKEGSDRDAIAKGAIARMLKTKPAPLMHKNNVKNIRAGNIDDNMDRLSDCDLIIEVVVENPAIKSATFKKIDAHRKAGSIVASNTSTIPLHDLIADQSDQLKKDFVVTHFFNPPRYMPLLELITSEHNDPKMVANITRFMDEKMGKGVVHCHDTPGFIANRIGTFWIQTAINEAIERDLTVEEADAIVGRPMGVPKTGVFGLVDLVGLDLMPHISKSLTAKLPATDAYVVNDKQHPVINKMIEDGYIGRKGKGGFYRLNANRDKMAVNLKTGEEFKATRPKMQAANEAKKGGLEALFESPYKGGAYAWEVFKQVMNYTAEHVHDIASDITAVDTAMKLGYNWKDGPFEMLDKLDVDYFIERVESEGGTVPKFIKEAAGQKFYKTENGQLQFRAQDGSYKNIVRPEGVLLLSDIKRKSKPLFVEKLVIGMPPSAKVWDIGDGVLCLEFTSKMNSLDLATMRAINKTCDLIEKKDSPYKALVVHNESDNFSLGANLLLAKWGMKLKQSWLINKMVKSGQETYKRLKYAKFPVVSAPTGMALGGGCEILLHSHHVQAHAETYTGLVEVGVGLLPAWGGSTELLTRAFQDKRMPKGPMPASSKVFEIISTAKVSTSAQEAKDLYYLRKSDGITMNKSRLLSDAKTKALELVNTLTPESAFDMTLPGPSGLTAFDMAVDGFFLKGALTPYDVAVSHKVAEVLTGGAHAGPGMIVTQDYLRALERKHFMELLHDGRTITRMSMMLSGRKRPDVEKVENKAKDQTPSEIRADFDRPGFFKRLFGGKSAKHSFDQASQKTALNDNNAPKRDPKAKMNWPKARGSDKKG